MKVEVLRFKPLSLRALRGFIDIYIVDYDMEIYGLTMFEKEGRRWFSMPSKELPASEDSKEKKYFPHVRLRERSSQDALRDAILQGLSDFLKNAKDPDHSIKNPTAPLPESDMPF
jgi:hypothetical protein